MFIATVINFLLSSLDTGNQVAWYIMFVRKALVLDINYPLLEKPELVTNALRNEIMVGFWAETFPVGTKLLIPDCGIYSYSVEPLLSDLIVVWRAWAVFQEIGRAHV